MLALALVLVLGQTNPHPIPRHSKRPSRIMFSTVELKKGPSDAFDQYVRDRGSALKGCYDAALDKNPLAQGTVKVDFDVVKGGVAADLRVTQESLGEELAKCVAAQVHSWHFPFEAADAFPARICFSLTTQEPGEFDDLIGGTVPHGVVRGTGAEADTVVRGKLDLKTIEVNGKTDEKVSRFVGARIRAPQGCYEKELKRNPALKGTITVEATLATTGRSTEITTSDDLGNDAVSSCVKAIVRGWTWPFKPDSPMKLKLVLSLRPAG